MSHCLIPTDDNSIPPYIESTKDLILPKTDSALIEQLMRGKTKDEDWEKAFAWYNEHINTRFRPLGMGCRPCYVKVIVELTKTKKIYETIIKN